MPVSYNDAKKAYNTASKNYNSYSKKHTTTNKNGISRRDSNYQDLKSQEDIQKHIASSNFFSQLKDLGESDASLNIELDSSKMSAEFVNNKVKAFVDKRLAEQVMENAKAYETNIKNAESKKKNSEKKNKDEEQKNPVNNTEEDSVKTEESEKKLEEVNPTKGGNGGSLFDKISGAVKNFKGLANEFSSKLTLSNLLKKLGLSDNATVNKLSNGFNNFMNQAGLGNIKLDVGALADQLGNVALNAALQGLASCALVEAYDYALTGIVIGLSYIGGDPTYKNCFYNVIMDCDLAFGLEWLDGREGDVDYDIDSTVSSRGQTAARKGCHRVARYVCRKWLDKMNAATNEETKERYKNQILKVFKTAFVYAYGDFSKIMLDKWFNEFDFIKPAMLGTSDPYKNGKFKITDADLEIMAPIIRYPSIDGGQGKKISPTYGLNLKGGLSMDSFTTMEDYIDLRNIWAKHLYVYLVNSDDWVESDRLTNEIWHDRLQNYKVLSEAQKFGTDIFRKVMESDLVQFLSSVTVTNVYTVLELLKKTDFYFDVKRYAQRGVLNYYWGDLPAFENYERFTIAYISNVNGSTNILNTTDPHTSKEEITLPASLADYINPGYKLVGWATSAKGTVAYAAGSKVKLTKNLILYAVWKKIKQDAGTKTLLIKGPEYIKVSGKATLRTSPSVTATWSVDDESSVNIETDNGDNITLVGYASAETVKVTATASGYTTATYSIRVISADLKYLKLKTTKRYLRVGVPLTLEFNVTDTDDITYDYDADMFTIENNVITLINRYYDISHTEKLNESTITISKEGYNDVEVTFKLYDSDETVEEEEEEEEVGDGEEPEGIEEEVGDADYIDASTTDGEIEDVINDMISDNIVYPAYFEQLAATINNFEVIMDTGLTYDQKNTALSNLYYKNPNLKQFSNRTLYKFNRSDNRFNFGQNFKFYTDIDVTKITSLNVSEQMDLEYFLIAYYVTKNYSNKYSYEVLKSLYGISTEEYVYQTDNDGNFVLDENGEKIVQITTCVDSFDTTYQNSLEAFEDTIVKLRDYFATINVGKTYSVKFNLQGLGKEYASNITNISNISLYQSIKDLKPENPSEDGFYFLGWATDPEGTDLWDWDKDVVCRNTVLYAIWKEKDFYIKYIKLPKNKNPSLETDVYGSVNETNKTIHFYLKSAEKSDSGYYIDIVTSPNTLIRDTTIVSGAYLDIRNKQITIYDDTYDDVSDSKTYTLEVHTLPNGYSRVGYITNGGKIIGENPNYIFPTGNSSLDVPLIKKRGYKCTLKTLDGEIFNYNYRIEDLSVPVFAHYEKIDANIIYKDAGIGNAFSGQHETTYPTHAKYGEITYLDTPTKDRYEFVGYYTSQICEDDDKVSYIPKYAMDSDQLILYAKWMDENEYRLLTNGIMLDGVNLNLRTLQLYEGFKFGEGDIWKITETGLVVFDSNGNKLDNITKNIAGTGYSPLGIGIFRGNTYERIFLVAMRNRSTNRVYLYYSYDAVNWLRLVDITNFSMHYYAGIAVEDVAVMVYFETVLFGDHYYSLSADKMKVIYDRNEKAVVLSIDMISNVFEKVAGHKILGISVTSSGIMYVLIHQIGVIKVENWSIIQDGENFETNPDITFEGVSGWLDDVFNVSSDTIGTTYNNVGGTPGVDKDIDVDDPETIKQILDFYSSKTFEIYTYLNVETSSGGPDENFGNGETKDLEWLWNFPTRNGELIAGATVVNRDNVRPSLNKRKQMISVERDKSKSMIEYDNRRTVDVSVAREVKINKQNYNDYLGWTRIIGPNETEKITLKCLTENDVLNGIEVTWNVKYSRSEIIQTTIDGSDIVIDKYVGNENYTQSKLFTKYLSKNKSNW